MIFRYLITGLAQPKPPRFDYTIEIVHDTDEHSLRVLRPRGQWKKLFDKLIDYEDVIVAEYTSNPNVANWIWNSRAPTLFRSQCVLGNLLIDGFWDRRCLTILYDWLEGMSNP